MPPRKFIDNKFFLTSYYELNGLTNTQTFFLVVQQIKYHKNFKNASYFNQLVFKLTVEESSFKHACLKATELLRELS